MRNLREFFQIDPDVIFLNHGSFGATPLPVFEAYQAWQRRLERQPVKFLIRELPDLLQTARQALADYVGAGRDDLVYVPNVTFGVNVVARSLPLGLGDEVLTTNHEYGACTHVWQFLSGKRGFDLVERPLPIPLTTPEATAEHFWQGVTPRTKVIYISHITSPTAVTLPVADICARAREAGILTVVDGAHAPGQVPLDMAAIGADFYTGNCHKWLCAPKGSAFLYARPERQHLIEPLVVGWGWGEDRAFTFGSDYLDYLQWLGTHDPAAYLTVPAAIEFQAAHEWTAVREQCHVLAREALLRIGEMTRLPPLYPPDSPFFQQMAAIPLPPQPDIHAFQARLYEEFGIEIPGIDWHGRHFIRISVQGYNTQADVDALVTAVGELLF
ncbi:MAG TPA: aminotransferase class V-fold PLP-dependent enzyme [Anaerolineae bacterium]|nr:aminotransferase class V-fold PLP-dependent enzyme [Anaerolineae bacterium]